MTGFTWKSIACANVVLADEYHQSHQELLVDVDRTLKDLSRREDIDGDSKITIEDNGPKVRMRQL
jgi:hypothetical protein